LMKIPITSSQFGSASILPISFSYIELMGRDIKKSTELAILNSNYVMERLKKYYKIPFNKMNGHVSHEFLIDFQEFSQFNIQVIDIAKRLMDYSFHAPTVAWPIQTAMLIEPTECENKCELDLFINSMINIRKEIELIKIGKWSRDDNPLKNAPHTLQDVTKEFWKYPYSKQIAVYPLPFLLGRKFWPTVNRIDEVYGDRNLLCSRKI
ncbi:hypothetical protein SNEBB_003511, partial [Seison nebaliae]